jgi:hypothetical protein
VRERDVRESEAVSVDAEVVNQLTTGPVRVPPVFWAKYTYHLWLVLVGAPW